MSARYAFAVAVLNGTRSKREDLQAAAARVRLRARARAERAVQRAAPRTRRCPPSRRYEEEVSRLQQAHEVEREVARLRETTAQLGQEKAELRRRVRCGGLHCNSDTRSTSHTIPPMQKIGKPQKTRVVPVLTFKPKHLTTATRRA